MSWPRPPDTAAPSCCVLLALLSPGAATSCASSFAASQRGGCFYSLGSCIPVGFPSPLAGGGLGIPWAAPRTGGWVVAVTVPTEVAQLGDPRARWAQLTSAAGKGSCEELGAAKPRSLQLVALLCVSTRLSPPQCAQGMGQTPAGVSQESWGVTPTQVVVAQV